MLWIKSLHIIAMVTWFAGLFYLPRLYVYHSQATDPVSIERFKIMERKLFYGIMTPGALLAMVFGAWLWIGYGISGNWLYAKLLLVSLVVIHHFWCFRALKAFQEDRNRRSHVFYRWMNEVPVFYLVGIVILAVVKPF